ncbi:MAG: carboxylating nicotinate-nucleotide diphosphorylase [Prevotella sp.]|jgi:nicotinate-nucleotide pyrophosphorylase (carboxylating)
MNVFSQYESLIDKAIALAFEEDVQNGDITTNAIIPVSNEETALLTMKADGVISGLDVAERVFNYHEKVEWKPFFRDGDRVKKGDVIAQVTGSYSNLLQSERTALNFLQRMGGIATATSKFVEAARPYGTTILDTRKTAPCLRVFDKIAVRHGGGMNHRMGLYDMVMLKDNHIKAAGGITPAMEAVKRVTPLSIKIEVETTTLDEVKEAVENGADIIMLDNMSNDTMAAAIKLINKRAKTEASGNMTLDRVAEVAALGVDYISVGSLTHHVSVLDISMNFKN